MNKSLLIYFFSIVRFIVQQYSISSRGRTIVYRKVTVEGKDVSKRKKALKQH
jgi:hypothetical protein